MRARMAKARRSTNVGYAKKRQTGEKKIQKVVRNMAETKYYAHNALTGSIQDPGRAPLEYHMTSITQGDSETTRDGNKILLTGFCMMGNITFPDSTNMVRIIGYVRKGPYTLNPLLNKNIGVNIFFNPAGYEILFDFVVTGGANGPVSIPIKKRISFKGRKAGGLEIQYSSAANNSVLNNQVGIYLVGNSSAVPDSVFQGYTVTYYKDF